MRRHAGPYEEVRKDEGERENDREKDRSRMRVIKKRIETKR